MTDLLTFMTTLHLQITFNLTFLIIQIFRANYSIFMPTFQFYYYILLTLPTFLITSFDTWMITILECS